MKSDMLEDDYAASSQVSDTEAREQRSMTDREESAQHKNYCCRNHSGATRAAKLLSKDYVVLKEDNDMLSSSAELPKDCTSPFATTITTSTETKTLFFSLDWVNKLWYCGKKLEGAGLVVVG